MKATVVARLAIPLLLGSPCAAGGLPVFLADNHAETFGWITRTFDLDEPHTLVLIDAHPDSNSAEKSEQVREQLRRVGSVDERAARVEAWRAGGRIQAFNWLEPLLPRPLERVLWVPYPDLTEMRCAELVRDAVDSLDERLEVEPRAAGSFAGRWEVMDMAGLRTWSPGMRPVILAVDLDFFTGMEDAAARFEELWGMALDWPGLAGVAFAVSRPWLEDDAEAERLVKLAVDAVRRTRGALLECDVSIDDRPDDSLRGKGLAGAGKAAPRWDVARSGAGLRALLAGEAGRWTYTDRRRVLDAAFWRVWPAATLTADAGSPDCDGVWRFAAGTEPALRVRVPVAACGAGNAARADEGADAPAYLLDSASGRVRWFARESVRAAYDLLPETGLGKEFARHPGRWIYEKRSSLGVTEDFALRAAAWKEMLDKAHGCGRVVVEAEYETAAGWLPVPGIELRVLAGEGFHGGLSECFGMPYAFGIAVQEEGGWQGADTGWGSDCSNFLAQAWRRSGVRIAWGDPGRLRGQLETVAENVRPESGVKLDAAMIQRGVEVDFGAHVAALWEDRAPLGVLDGGDLVAHHLGDRPEVLRLGELARERGKFAVRTVRRAPVCRLAIAGDVVLAGDLGRGLAFLTESCEGSDFGLANLEGIPSDREPEAKPKFDFRFPGERLSALLHAGIRVVNLANNHAADAGRSGIVVGRAALEAAGIGVVGAGGNLAQASRPWRGEARGVRLAVFGVSVAEAPAAGPDQAGVVRLPDHAAAFAEALQAIRREGAVAVVLVHWGDEHESASNDEQREWARWLAGHGASVVAGSGPHVVQPVESHGGTAIAHSLGNAIYPLDLRGRGSGCIWTVTVDANGSIASTTRRAVP